MQKNRFVQSVRRLYARYDRLMEKQGFYVVLALCVLIIAASALYTFYFREQWDSAAGDEPPLVQAAGGNQQSQTLQEARKLVESQESALSTAPPLEASPLVQPLDGRVERGFSTKEPQFFAQANVWRVHPGIDITADYGAIVSASASGTVEDLWQDNELGLCIRLSHAGGYETLYAGLSETLALRKGDPVSQGQAIAQVGNGVLAESDEEPHLHFEVWRNGAAVDPVTVFLGIDITF